MYKNKLILAPMVRVSTLPMRLTAIDYGADLVFTDEIIDKKIIRCERVINKTLGTVDYFYDQNTLVFRTCEKEKNRVIFQIGTASPELALEAALTVRKDVAGIDVNCGCPKKFSTHSGMGSALLKNPELLCNILKTLVDNVGLPITCKIRMLESADATIALIKRLESTGISAITLHCRQVHETHKDKGHWEIFKPIAEAIKIPLIANGDVFSWKEITEIRQMGISSVMIARAAQWNPSVFRKEGPLPSLEVCRKYFSYCLRYNIPYQNAKFVLCLMLESWDDKQKVHKCKCLKDFLPIIFNDDDYRNLLSAADIDLEKTEEQYDHLFPYIPKVQLLEE